VPSFEIAAQPTSADGGGTTWPRIAPYARDAYACTLARGCIHSTGVRHGTMGSSDESQWLTHLTGARALETIVTALAGE
jgi:hypothetical protein